MSDVVYYPSGRGWKTGLQKNGNIHVCVVTGDTLFKVTCTELEFCFQVLNSCGLVDHLSKEFFRRWCWNLSFPYALLWDTEDIWNLKTVFWGWRQMAKTNTSRQKRSRTQPIFKIGSQTDHFLYYPPLSQGLQQIGSQMRGNLTYCPSGRQLDSDSSQCRKSSNCSQNLNIDNCLSGECSICYLINLQRGF